MPGPPSLRPRHRKVFDLVHGTFARRPVLDLVIAGRAFARAHYALAADIADGKPPCHGEQRAQQFTKAKHLGFFWTAVTLRHALEDLSEEHDELLSPVLRAEIQASMEGTLRDLLHLLSAEGALSEIQHVKQLLPPREYLPPKLPEVISTLFGNDLHGPVPGKLVPPIQPEVA